MRKLKAVGVFGVFALSLSALLPLGVNASTNEMEVNSKEKLLECVATTGNVCKLTNRIILDNVLILSNDITIDLNGNNIEPNNTLSSSTGLIIVENGGKLTINDAKGTGKIISGTGLKNAYAGIQVNGSSSKATTLIVNGGTILGDLYGITGQ